MIKSLAGAVDAPITSILVCDDSADPRHLAEVISELQCRFIGEGVQIAGIVNDSRPDDRRIGLARSLQAAWGTIALGYAPARLALWILHMEDDFVFPEGSTLPTDDMIDVLLWDSGLDQMAVLRQPWFPNEVAAGGVIPARQAEGAQFTQEEVVVSSGVRTPMGEQGQPRTVHYVVHADHFTLNPSLYRRGLCMSGWPDGPWSESKFGRLRAERGRRFAYFGKLDDAPRVEHIGAHRTGVEY